MIHLDTFKSNYKTVTGAVTAYQWTGIATIINEWEATQWLTNLNWLAYMLATVKHETANTFRPIEEYGKGRGRAYGKAVNGHIYYGRGYVQLTWRENYDKMTKRLNELNHPCDLVNNPDQALDWRTATLIMFVGMNEGIFTGHKLADYFNDKEEDPIQARKIINGKDRAKLIAGYYYEFKKALDAARNA